MATTPEDRQRDERRGYRSIAEALRARIESGENTGRLSSEAELVEEFGAARDTVRRALTLLVDEGLLSVGHGRGYFISGGDPVSVQPKYVVVADELERQVAAGALKIDDLYPSEAEVQQQFEISRTTARRAFEALELRHLVYKSGGRRYVQKAKEEKGS